MRQLAADELTPQAIRASSMPPLLHELAASRGLNKSKRPSHCSAFFARYNGHAHACNSPMPLPRSALRPAAWRQPAQVPDCPRGPLRHCRQAQGPRLVQLLDWAPATFEQLERVHASNTLRGLKILSQRCAPGGSTVLRLPASACSRLLPPAILADAALGAVPARYRRGAETRLRGRNVS